MKKHSLVDPTHHIEEWHFAAPGKNMVQKFGFCRKRASAYRSSEEEPWQRLT
jgi:hypothetical protein